MNFRKILFSSSMFLIGMSMMLLIIGCQTSGQLKSSESSIICPNCKTETRTTPFQGINYKKHMCPDCRYETVMDETGEIAPWKTVHVCDNCNALVEKCPLCKGK